MIILYTSSEGIANTVVKEEIRYNWKAGQNRAYVLYEILSLLSQFNYTFPE